MPATPARVAGWTILAAVVAGITWAAWYFPRNIEGFGQSGTEILELPPYCFDVMPAMPIGQIFGQHLTAWMVVEVEAPGTVWTFRQRAVDEHGEPTNEILPGGYRFTPNWKAHRAAVQKTEAPPRGRLLQSSGGMWSGGSTNFRHSYQTSGGPTPGVIGLPKYILFGPKRKVIVRFRRVRGGSEEPLGGEISMRGDAFHGEPRWFGGEVFVLATNNPGRHIVCFPDRAEPERR